MFETIKNATIYADKYKTHPEAMIVSCYFNPQNSPYRLAAFKYFYETIKHLNHTIVECVIGDSKPHLEETKNIKRIHTENLLWHKEALLNKLISELPAKYKYIFWIDADVIFTNLNWLVDGVEELKTSCIIQPFEFCFHLNKDELKPSFDVDSFFKNSPQANINPNTINKMVWRSFCANCWAGDSWKSEDYNEHGHVGFAWAARREILDAVPLYDKALIGGADHIIAHAAAGQIPHKCIMKSFTDNLSEVNEWSMRFYNQVQGKISFVPGNLYHIWHGDIEKREYLKRIQDFTSKTKEINNKDKNGLYTTNSRDEQYIKNYFQNREVHHDDGFLNSMMAGYFTNSSLMGTMIGGNPLGAIVGDMLNDSEENSYTSRHEPNPEPQVQESNNSSDHNVNENFS